jgi:two-component system NtrC family sensor kinase
MSALREAQNRLVQSEKLAAIGELVAGVAHELNNPLTSIIGFAQLLQHSDISSELQQDLDKIVAQGQRVANIVRNLLDFARQRPLEKKPVQVNDVLRSTLDLLAYELHTHNVECVTHLSPDLPLTMADPHRLQQAFVNLINNAHYAMTKAHAGGQLTVTTEVATTAAFADQQADADLVIRIAITDDGPGILPDVLPRIFDPFYTTKQQGEGTGLGLSVCHGIVKEHNGHIWAENNPQQGATFFIELPVVTSNALAKARPAQQIEKVVFPRAARILAIDDELDVLAVLDRLLGNEGYQIDLAEDGETGLALIEKTDYDLILCDVRMPGMDGIEVYQRIKLRDPELAQRVVFVTGDTIRPTTRRFLEESGLPYLGKPFDLTDLIKTVRSTTSAPSK